MTQGMQGMILGPTGKPLTMPEPTGTIPYFNPPNNPLVGPVDSRSMQRDGTYLFTPLGMDSEAVMYRGHMFFPNPDTLIQKYGVAIYSKMMREVEVKNAVNSKRNAVIASRGEVIAASSEQKDLDIADFVRWNFANMTGSVEDFIFECLSSIIYGYSITEKIYKVCKDAPYKGFYVLSMLKSKHPDDYEFVTDAFANITAILLKSNSALPADIPLPPDKFVIHTYNPQFGWPHGTSDLRDVYKHYWSKDFLIKWWNVYMETFGMPLRVAKYPKGAYPTTDGGNNASQNQLQAALESIMNNTCITLPADIELELKEVTLGGAVAFQKAIEYHDKMTKTGILGETLTSGTGNAGGSSYALGKEHSETKEDAVERLRTTICDSVIFEQIIKQLVDINFPGVKRYPRFSLTPRSARFTTFTAADIVQLAGIGFIQKTDFDMLRDKMGMPPMAKVEEVEEPIEMPEEKTTETPEPEYIQHAKHEFKLKRAPNKYEKRVDFEKMSRDMDNTDETLIKELSAQVMAMKDKMLAYLPKIFKGNSVSMKDIESLKLIGLKDFAKTIETAYKQAAVEQTQVAYKEIGGPLEFAKSDEAEFDETAALTMTDKVVPAAEIAQIRNWKATGNYKAMKAWRERKAAELAGNIEAQSFWITDVVKTNILQAVKGQLVSGIQSGADVASMTKSVADVFEKYIARGDIKNEALASAPRLETIVRTNTARIFAASRAQAFREGAASGEFPAQEYSAILDDRTCEECEALDGSVYPMDDPIWGTITPPIHYNCRCTVVAVHVDDVPKEWSEPFDISRISTEFGGTG